MTSSGEKKLVSMIITVIIIVVVFGSLIGFKNVIDIISNFTHAFAFIITGLICAILGWNERKVGSAIFGIVTLILLFLSLK